MKKIIVTCILAGSLIMIGAGCRSVAVETPTPSSPDNVPQLAPNDFRTITQKTVIWDGRVYQFEHLCRGEVRATSGGSVPFCVGLNQLVAIDPSFNRKVLKSDTVATADDAPVLLGAELIHGDYGSKPNGTVLISYKRESCATADDCGAGGPTNHVSFAYVLSDQSLRLLTHFPDTGKAIWNPAGTKAIFYPNSCGGAGCVTVPLTGYDLAGDTTKAVTNLKAAGNEGVDRSLPDVEGNALPVWTDIYWKGDGDFEARIFNPGGPSNLVKGTF